MVNFRLPRWKHSARRIWIHQFRDWLGTRPRLGTPRTEWAQIVLTSPGPPYTWRIQPLSPLKSHICETATAVSEGWSSQTCRGQRASILCISSQLSAFPALARLSSGPYQSVTCRWLTFKPGSYAAIGIQTYIPSQSLSVHLRGVRNFHVCPYCSWYSTTYPTVTEIIISTLLPIIKIRLSLHKIVEGLRGRNAGQREKFLLR